jgi:hypothetical protein
LTKGLIEETGRGEGVGRPILYQTTPEFLQHFGLLSLGELPPLNLPEALAQAQAEQALAQAAANGTGAATEATPAESAAPTTGMAEISVMAAAEGEPPTSGAEAETLAAELEAPPPIAEPVAPQEADSSELPPATPLLSQASDVPPGWAPVAAPDIVEAGETLERAGAVPVVEATVDAEVQAPAQGEDLEPGGKREEIPLKLDAPGEPAPWHGDWAPVAAVDKPPDEERSSEPGSA